MNNNNLPTRVYYDVIISNLNNTNAEPPVAYYNQTRSQPYLLCPSKYNLIINRWTLDTQSLPIFRPVIQSGSEDTNLSIYSITLLYNGTSYQYFMEYSPQDKTAQVPIAPALNTNQLQNNNTGYYNVYSYQYLIYLINQTFIGAFNGLEAAVGISFPDTFAPVMTFDSVYNIATINSDITAYSQTLATPIYIYFNPALAQLFSSFPFLIESYTSTTGLNFQLQLNAFQDTNQAPFPTVDPLFTAIQTVQEYSTISNWNPVVSIVLTSSTLPVVPNNEGSPALYVNNKLINGSGNNSNIAQVITDFCADGIYVPNILYNPTAEFRRIAMVGNTPLSNLDVQIFWKDRQGQFNPFLLVAGASCTIKFLFELIE
jgi:hypothetical protein